MTATISPFLEKSRRVHFFVYRGRLRFSYHEQLPIGKRSVRIYCLNEAVPAEVAELGDQSIRNYAEDRIRTHRKSELKSNAKSALRYRKTDIPIAAKCGRVVLKGRITHAPTTAEEPRSGIRIHLEQPKRYATFYDLRMCFGLAMARKQIYSEGGVAGWAIEEAKRKLPILYKEQKAKERACAFHKVADRLNND